MSPQNFFLHWHLIAGIRIVQIHYQDLDCSSQDLFAGEVLYFLFTNYLTKTQNLYQKTKSKTNMPVVTAIFHRQLEVLHYGQKRGAGSFRHWK